MDEDMEDFESKDGYNLDTHRNGKFVKKKGLYYFQ